MRIIGQSQLMPPNFDVNCFPGGGLSQAINSGPDGLAPHRSHRLVERRPVGTNPTTSEATGDLNYLFRPPALVLGVPVHLRPRSSQAGEIGWHAYLFRDSDPYNTGHQILNTEVRREVEDRWTHRYQTPWYPTADEPGNVEAGGYYLKRFPSRPSTSYDFRSYGCYSPMTSEHVTSRWKRTPAATQVTCYDDAGSMGHPQSEEGNGGSEDASEQAVRGKSSTGLLKARSHTRTSHHKNVSHHNSSNNNNIHTGNGSYTTYSRLDTPASSESSRRQRSFY